MLRTARLLAVAAAATSTFALVPSAGASEQVICWSERKLVMSELTMDYRKPYLCP